MLKPEYYDVLTDDLIRLYSDLDNAIIADITRRILKTGKMTESAKWQAKQLQESGLLYDDILAEIASRTDATSQHVKALFEDAGVQSIRNDNRYYRAAGLAGIINMSDAALQVLNAGYMKCSGDLKNLTMTTAFTSHQAYITACNNAYMQVTSGAFDYNTAIRNAIKSAAVEGTHVLYPTGHKDRIDVAVRRSVLTGVGQTVRQLSMINVNDMDCDIMEITAHSGARPSHAAWQG
ncbi:MAG: phage minor capsid protein, partial [Ruminococcus sp.]|nr:phage minor capsid protein [Ruminococcus sp.]